jgi:hypothetical protein
MFYNAKTKSGYEVIGMAVSHDMKTWLRYGKDPVVDNCRGLPGDPQVVRIGNTWVMFCFGACYKPKAFETFAASHDLVTWTKWDLPHLIEPSEPWDAACAHKPWVIQHEGVVYHFYNAVDIQTTLASADAVQVKQRLDQGYAADSTAIISLIRNTRQRRWSLRRPGQRLDRRDNEADSKMMEPQLFRLTPSICVDAQAHCLPG